MFDFREIQRLVKLVAETDIDQLEVSRLWGRVTIRKRATHAAPEVVAAPAPPAPPPPPKPAPVDEPEPSAAPVPPEPADADLIAIRSPMVGTFYRAPTPDAAPFVSVGQEVTSGQVVCIIEAMKLMNEIESEVSGKVVKVLVENSEPVQYDQTLFLLQPGGG